MQIQRIQSVYIFLAAIAMAIFLAVPYGEIVHLEGGITESLYTMTEYGILIPVGAIILLLLVDLVLFRNLQLQRTVTLIFTSRHPPRVLTHISLCGTSCFPSPSSSRYLQCPASTTTSSFSAHTTA
mgnify:CR=1 FL=1